MTDLLGFELTPETARPNGHGRSVQAARLATLLEEMTGRVDENDVRRIVAEMLAGQPATVRKIEVTSVAGTVEIDGRQHQSFEQVLRTVAAGVSVMLIGPAGSGKTTMAENIAKALGVAFHFNGAVASEFKLLGFIDAHGRYQTTAFRKAFEHGGVYLFDEIDASSPAALLAFNAALANGYADFPDGAVQRHPQFYCLAAANTWGNGADRQYVGRSQLDGASLDRFARIAIDYDKDLELALCPDTEWCGHVQSVRAAVRKLGVRHIVSPRASINGAKMLAAGLSRDFVEASVLWAGLDTDTCGKVRAAMEA